MEAKTILVVDDEYDIASGLEMVFSSEGYQVRLAFNGKEALEALKAGPLPHLIISDIMMPVMNGYQFVNRLKADPKTRDIPVLLASAAPPDFSSLSKEKIALFIRKPFVLDSLLEAVEKLLK